jgi:hypothetical protein
MNIIFKNTAAVICIFFIVVPSLVYNTPFVTVSNGTTSVSESKGSFLNLNDTHMVFQTTLSNGPSSLLDNIVINVTSSNGFLDGYNLFSLTRKNRTDGSINKTILIITDMVGNIIAEKGNVTLVPGAEFINSTTVLYATDALNPKANLWNFRDNITQSLDVYGHHTFDYNPISDTIFSFKIYSIEINGTLYNYDYIMEWDLSGNPVWWMDTRDFIPIDWKCPYPDFIESKIDMTHSNSLFYDPDTDVLYFHPRNQNTFFKINHSSSEVIWGVGEYGNFTLFDSDGVEKESLFYHAHAVEQVDVSTFIIFDNDYHNQTDPSSKASRILEITIDEKSMTANESWSWTGSEAYYTPYWGDADRLPNGNRLGVFGTETHTGDPNMGARIAEVNESGDIVWEMNFPSSPQFYHGVYRVERFLNTPIIHAPGDVITQEGKDVATTWDVRYNFRPKWTIEGNYSFYLDGTEVENGSVFYDKLWRPVYHEGNLGILDLGIYNLTLAVWDEVGSWISSSINITVSPFYIDREGPVEIEIGQDNHTLLWYGGTFSPLTCNISSNATIIQSFSWTGSDIILDLETLGVGSHYLELQLYNSTTLLYSDSFWTSVFPMLAPKITSLQESPYSIEWNEFISLRWNLSDSSPMQWELYINSTLEATGDWSTRSYQVEWFASHLFELCYNITLVARDQLGQESSNQVLLCILEPIYPIIAASPENTTILWGDEGVSFTWITHGGVSWNIWRNGTVIYEGPISGNEISLEIQNWQEETWRPGSYNITLQLEVETSSVSSTFYLSIVIDYGDPYADEILPEYSNWYLFGDNVVGAPDGRFTTIYLDYGNGYIVLDMGNHEEILDDEGDDFTIIARGGNYTLSVSDSLDIPFETIAHGIGNMSFDLASIGLTKARYVRLEYRNGDSVEIDAIVAIFSNIPDIDTDSPVISNIADYWMWENQTSTTLNWSATDATPWSYSIMVNDTLSQSGNWINSFITFDFEPPSIGSWNVTVIAYDAFGNSGFDIVIIEIREVTNNPTTTPVTDIPIEWILFIAVSGTLGLAILILVIYRTKSKS